MAIKLRSPNYWDLSRFEKIMVNTKLVKRIIDERNKMVYNMVSINSNVRVLIGCVEDWLDDGEVKTIILEELKRIEEDSELEDEKI